MRGLSLGQIRWKLLHISIQPGGEESSVARTTGIDDRKHLLGCAGEDHGPCRAPAARGINGSGCGCVDDRRGGPVSAAIQLHLLGSETDIVTVCHGGRDFVASIDRCAELGDRRCDGCRGARAAERGGGLVKTVDHGAYEACMVRFHALNACRGIEIAARRQVGRRASVGGYADILKDVGAEEKVDVVGEWIE